MSTIFAIALAASTVTNGWTAEINLDQTVETYTMQTSAATCRLGWDGDLLVEVVSESGAVHRGYYMQNGRSPSWKPAVQGNPRRAFRLAGCAEQVPLIDSMVIRCQWMFLSIGAARAERADYDTFRCPWPY